MLKAGIGRRAAGEYRRVFIVEAESNAQEVAVYMPKQLPKPDLPEDSDWPEPISSFMPRPPRDVSQLPTEWLSQPPELVGEPHERRIRFAGFAEQHGIEAERLRAELPTLIEQVAESANLVTSWGLRLEALERQGMERSATEQEDYERLVEAVPIQRGVYEDLERLPKS